MLQHQVIVITGGAGLIGRSFVRAVVQNGGIGIIADINQELANKAKKDIIEELRADKQTQSAKESQLDSMIDVVSLDITSKQSLESAIGYLHTKYGKIMGLSITRIRAPLCGAKRIFLK